MVTKETPETFYVGKLVQATVVKFVYKKPQGDELDNAAPLRKGKIHKILCLMDGKLLYETPYFQARRTFGSARSAAKTTSPS